MIYNPESSVVFFKEGHPRVLFLYWQSWQSNYCANANYFGLFEKEKSKQEKIDWDELMTEKVYALLKIFQQEKQKNTAWIKKLSNKLHKSEKKRK